MFGQMGDMAKMATKYKKLQKKLSKTVIRANENGIIIDITAESKVKDVKIDDESLLKPENKEDIENAIKTAIQKAQNKAQEVAMEKTEEILWFNPQDLMWGMMGGQWGGGMPNIPGLG